MAYLLDANVFIAAKNLHYGLDFCPAFWDWLVQKQAEGIVFSVEKVRDEVLAVADDLADWIDQRDPSFFLAVDATSFPSLAAVSEWATGNRYDQAAVTTFLQIADYYLVAQALAGQHTVVTHEVPSATTRKIKIPDACIGLGISFMTPFQMLRRERARFIRQPRTTARDVNRLGSHLLSSRSSPKRCNSLILLGCTNAPKWGQV